MTQAKRKQPRKRPPRKGEGRPTLYKPEYPEQAAKLCRLGATDKEIADFFKVHIDTIYQWKNVHPEFSDALKVAKDLADDRVERSLYERAVGYTRPSQKICTYEGEVIRVDILEHVPPDVTAQIFWLKNRRKAQWRDASQVEVSGDLASTIAKARKRAGGGAARS